MANLTPIMDSFAAGELSPRMHLRSSLEVYRNAVSFLRNWISLVQGPAITRPPFRYKSDLPGNFARPFQFKSVGLDSFVVVVSDDGNLYLFDTTGRLIDPANNTITNPRFNDGSTGWTVDDTGTGSVVFSGGNCIMNGGDQGVWVGQEITITNQAEEHVLYIAQVLSRMYKVRIGTSFKDGSIAAFDSTPGQGQSFMYTPNNATIWISIQVEAGIEVVLDSVFNFEVSQAVQVKFAHPWDDDGIRALQVAQPPGDTSMYFVSGNAPVQKLTYTKDTDVWAFAEVDFTGKPAVWTDTNWPSAITFFQNRLWLAGTPNEPETFWGSKSNEFEDFTIPASPQANDGIEAQLNRRGSIVWIAGVRNLLIGTTNGEHIVTSEGGVLKTGDIQTDQQSAYGSARQRIEEIGNRVVYVSPDGRKIRDIGYQWTDESWVSQDLTFFSEHITEGSRIIESAWAPNPELQLWNVGIDGRIVGCTFDRSNNLIGFHRHDTQGTILAITSRRYYGFDQIWITVRRTVNGQPKLYLEAIEELGESVQLASTSTAEIAKADSLVIVTDIVPNGTSVTITVPHLAGNTVSVLADGAVYPDVTLDADGKGEMVFSGGYNGQIIQAGLSYDSTLVTLPADTLFQQGGTKSALKRYNKIYVSLLSSAKPLINGQRQGERNPSTPMNTREPPRTEYMRVVNLGYDRDGRINVTMDLPLHCEVNGLFGKLAVNQL